MAGQTTLSDVAKAAGVSLGTASNAFNRPERVRAELRELIVATAERLGYAGPDAVGRLLMGGKANVIGVLPPGDLPVATAFRNPFFHDFVLGIAEACDERAASMVILSGEPDRKRWAIANALVDGFILGHRDELALVRQRRRKVPSVVMDMDADGAASTVCIPARQGAAMAARHLLDLGHRRFGILAVSRTGGEPVFHPPGRDTTQLQQSYPIDVEKLEGYAEALALAGIPIATVPIVQCYPQYHWTAAGARKLLDEAPDITAVLCFSDRNAMFLLEEAEARGIVVPRDLSVIGYDDVSPARDTSPALTTIAQPLVEKGRLAARILFEGPVVRHEMLPVSLVVRGSTAPPRIV